MQIFENINSATFKFNNLKYIKNFMVIKQGNNSISVYNAFDTKQQLLESTIYSEVSVNGVVYVSQKALIDALTPLLFSKTGGSSDDIAGITTALNGKEPLISTGTTSQYFRGDKTFQLLDKIAVGLSNVDNTSDLNKPISTATQTALSDKLDKIPGSIYFVPKKTSTGTLENSQIFDSGVNGNVGVNTQDPLGKLHLNTADTIDIFTYASNSTGGALFGQSVDGLAFMASSYTNGLKFGCNYFSTFLEGMRLQSNGALLIGKKIDDNVNKLQVNGSVAATIFNGTGANITGAITLTGAQNTPNLIKGQTTLGIETFSVTQEGNFKAGRYELYGGLSTQFLKADGSTDSGTYASLSSVSGVIGKYGIFKAGGGLWEGQISESAGYVAVGGVGSYTDKFEVIGNVKATSFVGSGALLTGVVRENGTSVMTGDLQTTGIKYSQYTIKPKAVDDGPIDLIEIVRDGADVSLVQITAPRRVDGHREATLAFMREEDPSSGGPEFMDVYNNGYDDSHQMGIRIQSRGAGVLRDFVIDFFNGATYTNGLRIEPTGKFNVFNDIKIKRNGIKKFEMANASGTVEGTITRLTDRILFNNIIASSTLDLKDNGSIVAYTPVGDVYFYPETGWAYINDQPIAVTLSPTFTGIPKAPTATAGNNTTQLATTAFVTSAIATKANDNAVVHTSGNESITGQKTFSGSIKVAQYKLSALNTAPLSATDTGVFGDIRYDANYMYLCVSTNTWKRSALTTW